MDTEFCEDYKNCIFAIKIYSKNKNSTTFLAKSTTPILDFGNSEDKKTILPSYQMAFLT